MSKTPVNAHAFERAKDEWYVDPPSCAAALFEVQPFDGPIHDPCAGMGNIVHMADRAGFEVTGSDLTARPEHFRNLPNVLIEESVDYLAGDAAWRFDAANIVMNPPYGDGADGRRGMRLEEQFIDRALETTIGKVAVLLQWQWYVARRKFLEGRGLMRIWALTPRPSMLPGEMIKAGEMPKGGTVDYAWFVFLRGYDGMAQAGHAPRDISLDTADYWSWRKGDEL